MPDRPPIVSAHTDIRGGGLYVSFTSIGRYCSLAQNIQCGNLNHEMSMLSTHGHLQPSPFHPHPEQIRHSPTKHPPIISNDVWIGVNAIIMRTVTIGDRALVGSVEVVTKMFPPYAIVAGVPAKIIRYRFDEKTCRRLLETQWWNYDLHDICQMHPENVQDFLDCFDSSAKRPYKPTVCRISMNAYNVAALA